MTYHIKMPIQLTDFNSFLNKASSGWPSRNKEKAKQERLVKAVLLKHMHELPQPFNKRVALHFKWIETAIRRDPDNVAAAHKFILDAMVSSGLLIDDSLKYVARLTDDFAICRKKGWIEMTIEEVDDPIETIEWREGIDEN